MCVIFFAGSHLSLFDAVLGVFPPCEDAGSGAGSDVQGDCQAVGIMTSEVALVICLFLS